MLGAVVCGAVVFSAVVCGAVLLNAVVCGAVVLSAAICPFLLTFTDPLSREDLWRCSGCSSVACCHELYGDVSLAMSVLQRRVTHEDPLADTSRQHQGKTTEGRFKGRIFSASIVRTLQ